MARSSEDDSRVGTTIADRYRLDRVIGKGGMGVVYQGIHLWTERAVAVKLLATDDGENAAKRFLREARAAASVRHPNLVEVIDVGEAEDGLMYQVLELLEGESLLDHLRRKDKMRAEDVLDVLVPILDALAELHKANVLHRDIKPGNIFLSTDGRKRVVPKLLDLGISKQLDADEALTMTGSLMGTPSYMSPEQARGEPDVGFAADIWAMGVVLYQALSGERPFRADSIPGLLHRIATDRPPPLVTCAPNLPPSLIEAVDKALAYDPEDRHTTATEFADALVNAALSAGWPLTCRIPSGPRISLSPVPDEPHDTLDPDASPRASVSGRAADPDATPGPSADPDATPFSTSLADPDATPSSTMKPSSDTAPGGGADDPTPYSDGDDPDATPYSDGADQAGGRRDANTKPAKQVRAKDEDASSQKTPPVPVQGELPRSSRPSEYARRRLAELSSETDIPDSEPTGASRTGWMKEAKPAIAAVRDAEEEAQDTSDDGPPSRSDVPSQSVHVPMQGGRMWSMIGVAAVVLLAGGLGWFITATQLEAGEAAAEDEGETPIAAAEPSDAPADEPPRDELDEPGAGAEIALEVETAPDAGPAEAEAEPLAEAPRPAPRREPSATTRPRPRPQPSATDEELERGANNALILE